MRTFARFNLVGALGIGVQLGTLAVLTSGAGLPYLAATMAAVAAAITHNFLWHASWTWRIPGGGAAGAVRAFIRFALTNGTVSMAGNAIVMAALVSGAGLPPLPANVVAIGACGLANFVIADRVVFRGRRRSARQPTPGEFQP